MKTIDTVEIINNKHHSKATGALFLLDANQKLVQIYFVDGEMVSIKSRNISGRDVIKSLVNMKPVKFQFHDGAETRIHDNLPSTSSIINSIANAKNEYAQTQLLTDHIEKRARELFINYVGPIADVIFEEQIEKSASVDSLIQTLSSYIDNSKDKQEFINSLKTII